MKKKISIVMILFILFSSILIQNCFAKYIMSSQKQMSVYIDKTPPIIDITSDGNKESFSTSTTDIVKKTNDITIDTSDNIKIDHNEIYYNPTENNFNDKTPTNFENGKKITDEGYYKIIAVDTSGNKTEIIILLDKSAPSVTVQFYKKGAVSMISSNKNMLVGGVKLWS